MDTSYSVPTTLQIPYTMQLLYEYLIKSNNHMNT